MDTKNKFEINSGGGLGQNIVEPVRPPVQQKHAPEKPKFIPKPMPYDSVIARVEEKQTLVLVFLADEIWSTVKILSHVLQLSTRQTQKTLSDMFKFNYLKVEVLTNNTRLYGISPTGLAKINSDSGRSFQIGKTPLSTVTHHLYCQKIRIMLEAHCTKEWTSGKNLYKKGLFVNVPDGAFLWKGGEIIGVIEAELNIKSEKRMKDVFNFQAEDLGPNGNDRLDRILYFTPYPNQIRKLIEKLVDPELRRYYLVIKLSTAIHAFDPNQPIVLNDEIIHFLDYGNELGR